MSSSQNPKISVIIPTLNEEGFIEHLLKNILEQNGQREIIVSDSGSTDKTEDIVKEFIKNNPSKNIKFIRVPIKGVGAARNYGAKHAAGNYVAFIDADSEIPPDFLQNASAEMLARGIDIAWCEIKTNSPRKIDRFMFRVQNIIHRLFQFLKLPVCGGTGIIIKKNLHEEIGGFNENMSHSEDSDYCHKASKKGIFKMLQSTFIVVSMRRFEKEGRWNLWLKYIKLGLAYLLNIKTDTVEYEFGKFSKGRAQIEQVKKEPNRI